MTPIHILLVEDNPADVELVRQAFLDWQSSYRITAIDDGEDALEILRGSAKVSPALRPDVILLDLNLPRKGGFDVLEELSSDPILREIPVIVLTVSDDKADEERAYDLNASRFVRKPQGADEHRAVFGSIQEFIVEHLSQPLGAAE